MSTVRVYRSTDVGAPAHPTQTMGTLAALLRACLVTGYGTGIDEKLPAGWEEPYPETNGFSCFRALSGVRQFFQFNDSTAINLNTTLLTSFDSMSDAQTGIGPRGTTYFGKWYSDTAVTDYGWTVIADERTCYVLLGNVYGMGPHAFGEFYSYVGDDPYKSLIAGHHSSTSFATTNNYAMCAGYATLSNTYDLIKTVAPLTGYVSVGYGRNYVRSYSTGNSTTINAGDGTTVAPITGLAYPVEPLTIVSGNTAAYHGKFRGVYAPAAYKPKTHNVPFTFEGKTILPIHTGIGNSSSFTYQGEIWFDITGTWEESA